MPFHVYGTYGDWSEPTSVYPWTDGVYEGLEVVLVLFEELAIHHLIQRLPQPQDLRPLVCRLGYVVANGLNNTLCRQPPGGVGGAVEHRYQLPEPADNGQHGRRQLLPEGYRQVYHIGDQELELGGQAL